MADTNEITEAINYLRQHTAESSSTIPLCIAIHALCNFAEKQLATPPADAALADLIRDIENNARTLRIRPDTWAQAQSMDKAIAALRARAVPDVDVDLWSFLRDALKRGAAIESQFSQQGYEAFISEIEAAARKEDTRLRALLAASKAREGKV